jgi:hypothetical protein
LKFHAKLAGRENFNPNIVAASKAGANKMPTELDDIKPENSKATSSFLHFTRTTALANITRSRRHPQGPGECNAENRLNLTLHDKALH